MNSQRHELISQEHWRSNVHEHFGPKLASRRCRVGESDRNDGDAGTALSCDAQRHPRGTSLELLDFVGAVARALGEDDDVDTFRQKRLHRRKHLGVHPLPFFARGLLLRG
jgi:hypothetical protein